jgi:hypothetical protein
MTKVINQVVNNAKIGFRKVIVAAHCHLQIARAVASYLYWEKRLAALHSVNDAAMREEVGYKVRSSEVAFEIASKKLKAN